MRKQIIPLLLALSICLVALLVLLLPIWNPHSIAASQDKPAAAEVAAAVEEQKQEAVNLARSQLAEQKFQELSAKAQSGGTVSVIVQLRVAFRPEGEMLSAASVQAQRDVIHQTQDSLMKEMSGYDPASLKRFEYTPYVAVKVNAVGLEELRLSPNVIGIDDDKLLAPTLAESVPSIGAPIMWGNGFTGAGKTVAILDTGVDKTHPFLAGKVVSEACYSSNNPTEHASSLCPGGNTESTDANSGLNCAGVSGCDHGTHVAGIAAGKGSSFSGVAKDANLISIQVFSQITDSTECNPSASCIRSFTSDLMKALERVYSLRDTYSIASVNMSLGSGRFISNCDTNPLKSIIDQLRSAGIATAIASGNDHYTDAISEPACISSAISVGATGDGTILWANQVPFYSNSASFLNLLAPGDSITSSVPGGGFATFNGTSMAAPHVAGAWAILKQRTPTAGVTELLNYLTSRAYPVIDSKNGITRPRLNLGPPPSCIATNVPVDHWKGEYYSNIDLAGSPLMARDDGDRFLNFDFGDGSPNGACDLGADNFSARWTRRVNFPIGLYRFTVTGDDGVRLYIDGQLKIDKWLIQAPATYTADVFLTTGDHDVKLEYFEGGGGAVARLSWENLASNCYADVPSDHWKGEYFNNTNLTGDPMIVRDDGASVLIFDVGDGSPGAACGVGADNFSARWTRSAYFTTGIYRFYVTGDDGVRLYIDGQLKIDKWLFQAPTTYTAEVFLPEGSHEIKLEYFEGGGVAQAVLSWVTVDAGNCFASIPFGHWEGSYYNNTDLTGTPLMTRDDGDRFLNMDFGDGSPRAACGVNADNFSARWTRSVNFATGVYRFSVTGDDGVRFYIDGQLKIDKWFIQAPTTYTADVFISGGFHEIRLEYFDGRGGAVARVSWETLSDPNCYADVPSDHWRGAYYSATDLTGDPRIVRDEGVGFLNFDVGDGSPGAACGVGVDNFSARWTRTVNFAAGTYRFTVTGDDGVRLYIDGQLKIDKWFIQAPTTYTADVLLADGSHNVMLDYFEGAGGALARVSWETLPGDCFASVPFDHWKGTYYNNAVLTGDPAMLRDDGVGPIDFDFGIGSPSAHCGLGADNFSVRWTRSVNFTPGTYRFTVTGDDGVRLYIDGVLVINKWFVQGPTTYTVDRLMFGGSHNIMLEYFESSGGAQARLNWALMSGP
jgi:subtilisin family serine protease